MRTPPRPLSLALLIPLLAAASAQEPPPLSEASEACLACHEALHPGLVGDWLRSRHARVSVAQALERPALERRVSADGVPEALRDVAVGCAECHTLSPGAHPDSVGHGDAQVHPVVTPADCATCHPVEAVEYAENIMSHAWGNLVRNELFSDLARQVNGEVALVDGRLETGPSHATTDEDSCLACHGTRVRVEGTAARETPFGAMDFPVLSGWPNQGVGRINPDRSRGSCSACHTRHEFSIAMARKPATCAQCHKGPDVPAYPVWEVSKHGNLYAARGAGWEWEVVPWQPGAHFTAPTCAACHASLLASADGEVLSPRTHRMGDRLWVRLFGLPYAHAHPRDPSTQGLRNAAGLPLPVELTGEPVAGALIDAAEQDARRGRMQAACRACHASGWIEGHFARLEHSVQATNAATRVATQLLQRGWERGVGQGPAAGDSLFDDTLERLWVQQWLFFANSTRFASAMGGADYGVFANGRFHLARNLREMETLVDLGAED